MSNSMTPVERFWSKVDKTEGCWNWTTGVWGGKIKYGKFHFDGAPVGAHRFSYSITFGDPGWFEVCHRCDNPLCVRPDHLFLGTHRHNMIDAFEKGRKIMPVAQNQASGEGHYNSRMTPIMVWWFRYLNKQGTSCRRIAQIYGLSKSGVEHAISGRSWSHV